MSTSQAGPEHTLPGPCDLAKLRIEHPSWRFGTVWASAASDPNARRLWASRNSVLLTAWTAPELRLKIAAESPR